MDTQTLLYLLVGIIPMIMSLALIYTKIKAGKSIMKVKNTEDMLLCTLTLIFIINCIYIIFSRNTAYILYIIVLLLMTAYLISYVFVRKSAVREKGIIVFCNFPYLLKWNEIKRFRVHGKKIYFEKENGYVSINVLKKDIKDIAEVISDKVI